jgi:hypothetical protein
MEDSKKSKRIVWKPEVWDINKLKPYDKNPRIITEFGLDQLKDSFDEIGMAQPINVNTDGTILSGHARWQQLKKENYTEVQVMVPDRKLTPKQEEAVIVRMNKNTAGQWDFDKLSNEFNIDDLLEWGFSEKEFGIGQVIDDLSDKNKEIDTENFGNDLQHQCPKCGFEFNE